MAAGYDPTDVILTTDSTYGGETIYSYETTQSYLADQVDFDIIIDIFLDKHGCTLKERRNIEQEHTDKTKIHLKRYGIER